jgi:hypothetical protein
MSTPIRVNIQWPALNRLQRVRLDLEVLNDAGTAYDFTGKRVDISLSETPTSAAVLTLSSVGGSPELTLTSGNIAVDIPASSWDLAAQTYFVDLRVTDTGDLTNTYIWASGTWIVYPTNVVLPA